MGQHPLDNIWGQRPLGAWRCGTNQSRKNLRELQM